jgi:membrane protease YdiL (CAAX protease family)
MRIAFFFALAFGLTWLCWIPAALGETGAYSASGRLLLYAGSAGPLLATLICLAPASQRRARARWWRRLTCVGGLASPAGAMAVLAPVLAAQLALDSYAFTGGIALPAVGPSEAVKLLLPTLLFGALSEEPAWRGYALPAMLRGRDPLAPTLLLAAAWAAWQLPLFFVKGTLQAGIDPGSAAGLMFFVGLASQSLLMTAFYLATRSTWAAVLFHWLTSLTGELWQLPVAAEVHRALWQALFAGIALLVAPPFGLRRAARRSR